MRQEKEKGKTGERRRKTLDDILGLVNLFQQRNQEGSRLSRSVLCSGENVTPGQRNGDALLLNGRRFLKAHLKNAH